jgi:hypothetical protein
MRRRDGKPPSVIAGWAAMAERLEGQKIEQHVGTQRSI